MRTRTEATGQAPARPRVGRSFIIEAVTSPLSSIAVAKRRQLAATLGLFSMLFIAVGAVAATGASTGLVKAFVVVALLVAVTLALMAWGVLHSVKIEIAERRIDAAIEQVVASRGESMCDCGHEHDPTEMHIVDAGGSAASCAHDGAGRDCAHSCDTCVLAAMRPLPGPAPEVVLAGARPSPSPSPRHAAPAERRRPSPHRAG
jgi:hypothetical protein